MILGLCSGVIVTESKASFTGCCGGAGAAPDCRRGGGEGWVAYAVMYSSTLFTTSWNDGNELRRITYTGSNSSNRHQQRVEMRRGTDYIPKNKASLETGWLSDFRCDPTSKSDEFGIIRSRVEASGKDSMGCGSVDVVIEQLSPCTILRVL
jgi:hypothetical protein